MIRMQSSRGHFPQAPSPRTPWTLVRAALAEHGQALGQHGAFVGGLAAVVAGTLAISSLSWLTVVAALSGPQ